MILFKSNKISAAEETVAEQLAKNRIAKNIEINEIAKKINISPEYLLALENGEHNKLPTGVYAKNFLREYALFLGLDYKELAHQFDQEKNIYQTTSNKELFSKKRVKKREFLAVPKIIKASIVIIITLTFFFYLGFSLKKIISPPSLIIYNPTKDYTTSEKTIQIFGQTEAEALVLINGEQILSDSGGKFEKEINLKEGINNITITASKKYGRDNTIIRQVLVIDE